jgi:hypothetical protein
MKNLKLASLLLFAVFLGCFAPRANAQIGNVTMLVFPGAPSGACSTLQVGLNMATGAIVGCNNGAWGSGGGSGLPTGLTFASPTLTISSAGNGNGALAQAGNTSGTCTRTVDATGTTITETCNHALPDGTTALPAYSFSGQLTTGWWRNGSGSIILSCANNNCYRLLAGFFVTRQDTVFCWGATTDATGGCDTGFSRSAAQIINFGNGTAASTVAKLKASGYMSVGTKFTTNNGCTDGANAGGGTAGYFVVGSTSCTEVITMGDSATAPNGWSCTVVDITTLVDVTNPHQTTSNATTATIVTGTVVSGDKIQFSCIGY